MEPGITLRKLHISLTIYYTQFAFGCVDYMLSPLVIELSEKFHSDVPTVSVVFAIHTASYLTSSLISGIAFKYVNRHAYVIVLVTMVSIAVFLMPHVSTIEIFYILGSIIGIGGGSCDTAQITWIIELWRDDKAAPFILAQHTFYALGILVPPLLLTPFLDSTKTASKERPTAATIWTNVTSSTLQRKSSMSTIENVAAHFEKEPPPGSDLVIPMSIFGAIMGLAALSQAFLFFVLKFRATPASDSISISSSEQLPLLSKKLKNENEFFGGSSISDHQGGDILAPRSMSSLSPKIMAVARQGQRIGRPLTKMVMVILSCCIIGFYQGVEMISFQFFPTYCVYSASSIGLSEAEAAQILFGLSLTFAIGRSLGILVVLKVKPQFILLANFTLILIANLILYLLANEDDPEKILWMGSLLLGLGFSTVYPAFYAFIEKRILITGRIVTAITVSSGVVASIYPNIVGKYVADNPSVLNYVIFCSLGVISVCFATTYLIFKFSRRFDMT